MPFSYITFYAVKTKYIDESWSMLSILQLQVLIFITFKTLKIVTTHSFSEEQC
jgi:hypothetical protein